MKFVSQTETQQVTLLFENIIEYISMEQSLLDFIGFCGFHALYWRYELLEHSTSTLAYSAHTAHIHGTK